MTARAQCECCERVRKPTLKVVKCKRCGKHVCENEDCRVPHALGVCGDKFANEKARAIATDLPPTFAPPSAVDPIILGDVFYQSC